MIKYTRVVCTFVILMLVLASCATPKKAIPFDSAATQIKTIGIIEPYLPDRADVVLASSVGQSVAAAGGLIGALVGGAIDESMHARRRGKFNDLVEDKKFVARDNFKMALTNALAAQGYKTVIVPIERPVIKADPRKKVASEECCGAKKEVQAAPTDFRINYPPPGATDIDAYLDIVMENYGYLSPGVGSPPYRPFVYIKCRLVRASDNAVLMEDLIAYNPLGQPKEIAAVAPNPAYSYEDLDQLIAASDKAIEGLEVAFTETSGTLASLLR